MIHRQSAQSDGAIAVPPDDGRGAIVVFLFVIALVIPVEFRVGTLALSLPRLILLITIIPTTIGLFTGRFGRVYLVDILFALHGFWVLLSIALNNPVRVVEAAGIYNIEFFGAYVLARACIRTPQAFYRLIRAVLVFTVLSLPLAIFESLTDESLVLSLIEKIPGVDTVKQLSMPPRLGLHRSQVSFQHPIHYGLFCTAVLALTWIGMKGVLTNTLRYLAVAAVGAAVFLSLSSGALLAALMQGGLIVWNYVFRRVSRRWLLLAGIFAFGYVLVDLLSNRTPIRVFMSYATFSAHNAFWRGIIFEWGLKNVWDNPIFGLGLRNWIRPSFMRSGSIDNYWLVMAVKFGIPGFAMVAGGYLDAMIRVGRRKLTPGSFISNLRLGWMFMCIGLAFALATVHIWGPLHSFVFFLVGSGMWIVSATDVAVTDGATTANTITRDNLTWSRSHPERGRDRDEVGFARKTEREKLEDETRLARYTRFAGAQSEIDRRRKDGN